MTRDVGTNVRNKDMANVRTLKHPACGPMVLLHAQA